MNDPYRLDPSGRPPAPTSRPRGGGTALRAVLWVVFIVSAATNMVGNNIGGGSTPLGMGAGIIAVGCIAGLIAHHFMRRRS